MTLQEYIALHEGEPQTRRVSHPEHEIQVACVRWFNAIFPEYRGLLFAVPNGAMLNGSVQRRKLAGARLREEGMVSGVADLLLLVPRGDYHGLCVEMKAKGGVQSQAQKKWQSQVEREGYRYIVIKPTKEHTGTENFISEISKYLKA